MLRVRSQPFTSQTDTRAGKWDIQKERKVKVPKANIDEEKQVEISYKITRDKLKISLSIYNKF